MDPIILTGSLDFVEFVRDSSDREDDDRDPGTYVTVRLDAASENIPIGVGNVTITITPFKES